MVSIEGKRIGINNPVYVIAEAGINHNGDIKIAKRLVDAALEAGADAIKFQTYKTEEFVTRSNQYFDLFKNAELAHEDFAELKDYSKNNGITFFSTPFDIESADFLKKIGVSCFKIASSDLTNIPLIKHISKMNTTMIISTGLSTMEEIYEAVNCCLFEGNKKIVLLHCVASYPTLPEETNLTAMNFIRDRFGFPVGYSDNGESTLVDLTAVSMGANLIEKHFTLDKKMNGPDHSFSIEPQGLKTLISQIRLIEKMKGDGIKLPQTTELEGRYFIRKSITARKDIKINEILTKENISIKRPAEGIEPKYLEQIVGKRVNKEIRKDTAIYWKDLV
jgi:N,N'-diacetyllegionaminate synthase